MRRGDGGRKLSEDRGEMFSFLQRDRPGGITEADIFEGAREALADFETVMALSEFEPLIFEQGDGVAIFRHRVLGRKFSRGH
jgi:hypothetical protein